MSRSCTIALLLVCSLGCALAACPFATLLGDGNVEAIDAPHHRRLLQRPGGGAGAGGAGAGGGGAGGQQPGGGGGQQPGGGGGAGGQQPGGQQPGGGGNNNNGGRGPCNLSGLLAAGPYSPAGPSSQTGTDELVKSTARAVFAAAMTRRDGSLNTNIPLGTLLRAAFHDAGTFSRANSTGGANGSLRNEGNNPDHAGLQPALNLIESWRSAINGQLPSGLTISYADMYQLAGAAAVEATGGPSLYAAVPVGRVDAPAESTAQLPGNQDTIARLECTFVGNGYTLAELVALSGAHTIGFQRTRGGRTPLSPTPFAFNNDYFTQVAAGRGALGTDNALRADPTGTLPLVQSYATSEAAFFKEFASAYVKMGRMGATWRSYTQ